MAYVFKRSSEEGGHESSDMPERLLITFSVWVPFFSNVVDKVCRLKFYLISFLLGAHFTECL